MIANEHERPQPPPPGRVLGRSGIDVGAMGVGCWTIGGPFTRAGRALGWGAVEPRVARDALRTALDAGIRFFDTADVYGAGRSELLIGSVVAGRRDELVLATKFGNVFDSRTREVHGTDVRRAHVERACEDSLRRLRTDYIDLYQLHLSRCELAALPELIETLEDLVAAGRIRAYGWSTDDPDRAAAMAAGPHCATVQLALNLLQRNDALLAVCRRLQLGPIARSPLAMGILSGRFRDGVRLADDDVRRREWDPERGPQRTWPAVVERVRELLTADGRSLVQGAIGWLWAHDASVVPIPGFRDAAQVAELAASRERGPLPAAQVVLIERELAALANGGD